MSSNLHYGYFCNVIRWDIYYKLIGKHTSESYNDVISFALSNIRTYCHCNPNPDDITVNYNGRLYTI